MLAWLRAGATALTPDNSKGFARPLVKRCTAACDERIAERVRDGDGRTGSEALRCGPRDGPAGQGEITNRERAGVHHRDLIAAGLHPEDAGAGTVDPR